MSDRRAGNNYVQCRQRHCEQRQAAALQLLRGWQVCLQPPLALCSEGQKGPEADLGGPDFSGRWARSDMKTDAVAPWAPPAHIRPFLLTLRGPSPRPEPGLEVLDTRELPIPGSRTSRGTAPVSGPGAALAPGRVSRSPCAPHRGLGTTGNTAQPSDAPPSKPHLPPHPPCVGLIPVMVRCIK